MNIIELRNLFNNTFGMYVKGTNTKSINLPMETLVENIKNAKTAEQCFSNLYYAVDIYDQEIEYHRTVAKDLLRKYDNVLILFKTLNISCKDSDAEPVLIKALEDFRNAG